MTFNAPSTCFSDNRKLNRSLHSSSIAQQRKSFFERQTFAIKPSFGRTRRSAFHRSPPVCSSSLFDPQSDRFRRPQSHRTAPLTILFGPEHVKAFLQQRFLIFGVRCALRTLSHRYFTCRRFRAQNVELKMVPLPSYRFPSTDQPFPFEKSGVDVFGPFFIVNGQKTDKHYGIIFNCLVTRACH